MWIRAGIVQKAGVPASRTLPSAAQPELGRNPTFLQHERRFVESRRSDRSAPNAEGPEAIPVIAAVVERAGRYLVGKRPPEKRHGSMWEFPGGKLRPGEGMLEAARRELGEELALEVRTLGNERFRMRDPGSPFVIVFVEVRVAGEPRALEHSALEWRTPEELLEMPLCPSDAAFVRESLAGSTRHRTVSRESRRGGEEG
jgi:8-oxo-dGTP diphosphatase